MHLSKLQHQGFWHRGWMVVESVFAVDEVDSIAQLATRLCERELYASDSTSAADRSNDGLHVAPRKLGSPFTKSPEFAKFIFHFVSSSYSQVKSFIENCSCEQLFQHLFLHV